MRKDDEEAILSEAFERVENSVLNTTRKRNVLGLSNGREVVLSGFRDKTVLGDSIGTDNVIDFIVYALDDNTIYEKNMPIVITKDKLVIPKAHSARCAWCLKILSPTVEGTCLRIFGRFYCDKNHFIKRKLLGWTKRGEQIYERRRLAQGKNSGNDVRE